MQCRRKRKGETQSRFAKENAAEENYAKPGVTGDEEGGAMDLPIGEKTSRGEDRLSPVSCGQYFLAFCYQVMLKVVPKSAVLPATNILPQPKQTQWVKQEVVCYILVYFFLVFLL